jgi:hypothetical protein
MARHIDDFLFRGESAEPIARIRANDERLGRRASLSKHTGLVPLDKLLADDFATRPWRYVWPAHDGVLVDVWRDHTGKFIPRPVDAAPLKPAKLPPSGGWRAPPHIHGFLCHALDGTVWLEWYDAIAKAFVPAPAGCPWAEFSPAPPRRRSRGDLVLVTETDSAGNIVETWYDRKSGKEVPAPAGADDDARGEGTVGRDHG